MDFTTEIESNGDEYHLEIKTSYRDEDGLPPKFIDIIIFVSKIVGSEKFSIPNLRLKYFTTDRSYLYTAADDIQDDNLYEKVIDKLDETYGDQWGYSAN